MDIRSFFPTVSKKVGTHKPEEKPKKESKKAKLQKSSNSSIDDIIPETPEPKASRKPQKQKVETKRKRITVISDSDSDSEIAKPKVKNAKIDSKTKNGDNDRVEVISDTDSDSFQKSKSKAISKVGIVIKEKTKVPEKPKKYVNLDDAFGDEPVKQTKVEKPKPRTELNIHDDEDFEKTLMELDESDIIQETPSKDLKSKSEYHVNAKSKKTPEKNQTPSPEKKRTPSKSRSDSTPKTKSSKTPEKSRTPSKSHDSAKKEEKTKTPSSRKLSSTHSNDSPASSSGRKRKISESDDGTNKDLERYEKKQYSAMLYQKYLHRSGPAHLGSKWLPKGNENCLKDLTFVITGVLDSLQREDAENLIAEHGGKCMKALSGKTKYLIVGDDAGPSKLEKANKFGTKVLNEDELIDLICDKSGIKNKNKVQEESKEEKEKVKEEKIKVSPKNPKEEIKINSLSSKLSQKLKNDDKKEPAIPAKLPKKEVISDDDDDDIPTVTVKEDSQVKTNKFYGSSKSENKKIEVLKPKIEMKKEPQVKKEVAEDQLSWVDKYKPKELKQIIGQQTDGSNAKKLLNWLKNWYKNHDGKTKLVKPSPWAKNDNGAYFKAALLSGPPGVGKTTTANVVARELGFDVVEFNASDTRSKKMLHEEVAQLIKTRSLAGYFQDGSAPTNQHVLLMDEVDGMSGNEDRGGMQELIDLIKKSSIPIICMCNDRQHQKVRSLANYCFDLRFGKPRLEQIRGAMMSICFKEEIDISTEALTDIIVGSGMDIRQILNNLSMWSAKDQTLSKEDTKKDAAKAIKDVKLGPWDVIRKVFSEEDHKKMSFQDKYDLFFYDYSINPLFVQENYLQVKPNCSSKEVLSRVAYAADSISQGDLVDAKIRGSQSWGLLDSQALFSSVIPGYCMEGQIAGQLNFPGWLGKNSRANKFKRMLGELQSHMRTTISGCRQAVNLDYLSHIYRAIVTPLEKEGMDGIPKALAFMQEYHLMREDLTNLAELVHWPKSKDLFKNVDSRVKAAFTKAYNKDIMLPYAVTANPVKKRRGGGGEEDEMYGDDGAADDDGEEEVEEDDITNNPMIKVKKPSAKASAKEKAPAKEKKEKASSSRGKAPRAKRGK